MKEKLQEYKAIIPTIIVAISVFFFLGNNLIVGTILLLSLIIFLRVDAVILNDININAIVDDIKLDINENISNLIYPIAIIKDNGDLKWANIMLNDILELSDIESRNIISLTRELDIKKLLKCDKNLNQIIKIKTYIYSVYASKIYTNEDNESLYVVYFIEISNLKDSNSTKESVMIIDVDNLSEVLETTEDSDRPMLVADIEKTINIYAQSLNAMLVKYSTSKFVLSVIDKHIDSEIENKFEILKKISQIERGNKFEVTLSIGIGRGASTPHENYNNAIKAKELALGRGGNQVVVKKGEKIVFFGGNSREMEKRTRVRARLIAKSLKELIYESSNILIMGHKTPDMDCLGAAVGLSAAINKMGKSSNIILDGDTNGIDYYMDKLKSDEKYNNLFINSEEANTKFNENTLLIIVDVHNKGYVNNIELVNKIDRKIIIDHHRRSPNIIDGALLNYIEVYASSTSEMVTELIQYMLKKPKISKIEAEGLLAGIVMDTKGFEFKSGVRTFDAASFLRTLGADPLEVKNMFTDSLEDYLIIAETIKNAKVYNNLAIAVYSGEIANPILVAKAADELLTISEINVCFVLSKINDKIVISGRSIGDINVQVILEEIGGGGHINMAGAQLDTNIEDAIYILKKSITKYVDIDLN